MFKDTREYTYTNKYIRINLLMEKKLFNYKRKNQNIDRSILYIKRYYLFYDVKKEDNIRYLILICSMILFLCNDTMFIKKNIKIYRINKYIYILC